MDESVRQRVVVQFVAPDDVLFAALSPLVIEERRTALTRGSILRVDADAIVSPSNSFGFMDGGLDAQLLEHYGPSLQRLVHLQLQEEWDGEIPVGCAMSLPLPGNGPNWLIVAPTMRVPMRLPHDTVNPYLAIRAVVREAARIAVQRDPSQGPLRVAMPGMGTGIGGVTPTDFAHQAKAALESLRTAPPGDWWEASRRHQLLTSPVVRDLQLPDADKVSPHEPNPGVLIVEDSVDALGDRVVATISEDDSGLVVRVHEDDGFEVRHVEVTVPTAGLPAQQLAERFHGRGADLLDHVRQLPGAEERGGAQEPS